MLLEQRIPHGPGLDRAIDEAYKSESPELGKFRRGIHALVLGLDSYEQRAFADPFTVPTDFLRLAGELGLIAPNLPKQHGGLGLSLTEVVKGSFELGYRSPGFDLALMAVPYSLVGIPIEQGMKKADTQRRGELLGIMWSLQTGREHAFFGLTEPKHGSDVAKYLEFQAREDGEYLVLNGTKSFITNPEGARWGVVTANLNGEAVVILADVQTPQENGRFEVLGYSDKIGQYGPVLTTIEFRNFRVKRNAVLGSWREIARPTLVVGRNIIAAQSYAAMVRALDLGYNWASYREQFGAPLIQKPGIAERIQMGYERALVCEALLLRSTEAYDAGDPNAAGYASLAKAILSETALAIGLFSQQLFGARGFVRRYVPKEGASHNPFAEELRVTDQRIGQLVIDMMAFTIYEGPSTLQSDVLMRRYFWDQMGAIRTMLAPPQPVFDIFANEALPTLEQRLEFVRTLKPSGNPPPKELSEEKRLMPFRQLEAFLRTHYVDPPARG